MENKNTFITLIVLVIVIVSLFDPSNSLVGLKTPLFMFLIMIWISIVVIRGEKIYFKKIHLIYVITFIFIPLMSVLIFTLTNSGEIKFEGYSRISTFLFLIIILVIEHQQINFISLMIKSLLLLAFATVAIFIIIQIIPIIETPVYFFGLKSGMFTFTKRHYGQLNLSGVYFHTSSLMLFSLGFYAQKYFREKRKSYFFLGLLTYIALIISASRNNIIFSHLTILLIAFKEIKNKIYLKLLIAFIIPLMFIFYYKTFMEMLSPTEFSNSIKLSYFTDYIREFSNLTTLFFGMGLGSYFYVNGYNEFVSVTELTYFEIIRNYGILFGFIVIVLMIYPLKYLKYHGNQEYSYVYVTYSLYLLVCISNPLFFSSSGVLLVACIFSAINSSENGAKKSYYERNKL